MQRKILFSLLFAGVTAVLGTIWYWGNVRHTEPQESPTVSRQGTISIVATFYPLAEFARGVARDRAEVLTIISGAVEPHDYEPTPLDILAARKADVFLFNGAGLDPWAEDISDDVQKDSIAVLKMADFADLLVNEDDKDEHEDAHERSGYDPHFWLDPIVAKAFVVAIRDALVERDPSNADAYGENARVTLEKLDALDAAYRKRLSSCAKREIIASHDAFGYLERRYGFTTHAISGISPEEDPSPKRIAELADLAKNQGLRYIFFETLVSPKVAETLAREVNAETMVFDPIEGLSVEDANAGKNYFTIMRENLENLATAMECK